MVSASPTLLACILLFETFNLLPPSTDFRLTAKGPGCQYSSLTVLIRRDAEVVIKVIMET